MTLGISFIVTNGINITMNVTEEAWKPRLREVRWFTIYLLHNHHYIKSSRCFTSLMGLKFTLGIAIENVKIPYEYKTGVNR